MSGQARGAADLSGTSQGELTAGGYAEDRCALSWRLQVAGLYLPAFAVAFFAVSLLTGMPAVTWTALAVLFLTTAWWAAGGSWIRYLWPTGIRIDADGVRIGGVGWAERHRGQVRTRTAIVPRQCSQVFACPWSGVLSIGVTGDDQVLKAARRQACRGRKPTPLGNLAVPSMRAALVLRVDTDRAQVPAIRAASGIGWYAAAADGYHQPLWVVPTRRPARLREALAMLPPAAAVLGDPRAEFGDGPSARWPQD